MAIATFLTGEEVNSYLGSVTDKEIAQIVGELRNITGRDWVVHETKHTHKSLFGKITETFSYTVYLGCENQYQVINFYNSESDWSINGQVPANIVHAYLMGMLAGGDNYRSDIIQLKKEIGIKDEKLHKKNVALDALHHVWCNGGCESGIHRHTENVEITDEMIEVAEQNLSRLKKWRENKTFRDRYESDPEFRDEWDKKHGLLDEG